MPLTVPSSSSGGFDVYSYRQRGTSVLERWYSCGAIDSSQSEQTLFQDNLYAMPFVSVRSGVLDRVAFNVTLAAGVGGVARCGIYQATSSTNLYPNARIVDGGEQITTGSGRKDSVVNVTLAANTLYWFCILGGIANPQISTLSSSGGAMIIGYPSPFPASGDACGTLVAAAFGYQALPATFPAGANAPNSFNPVVLCRYAS